VSAFQIVKKALQGLGYSGDLLQENYVFDDASAAQTKELCLPLGAFAQWPPSYRSACIGVIQANGNVGPRFVSSYRALGAPMFLEVHKDHVVRYRMEAVSQAVELESVPFRNISKAFESNKDKWSPEAIFRAKAISPISGPTQLDFFDTGLLPALKGMIHRKLDRLLKETLHAAIFTYRRATSGSSPDKTALFRLIFRFLAAKIFNDKRHSGNWSSSDPRTIIDSVQRFYGLKKISTGRIIDEPHTQQAAWDHLRTAFNFQNLSEEDLAFVYENTLVSKEARREHGIHATPSVVAELIVDRLPFEEVPQDERFVLEPCAGHGVFLVAALRRLRDLLPASWTAEERHVYFRERLKAIERDTFAGEVCRLSLTLADYPNPDGWEIVQTDIFGTDALENNLPKSRIVLCNPPFEDFNEQEREQYRNRIQSVHKPYEILRRVLENPPAMLGFVLPKSAIIGGRYDELQSRIAGYYTDIETVALPDRVFAFSEQETMLVLASGLDPAKDARVYTKTSWVREEDRQPFLEMGQLPEAVGRTTSRGVIQKAHKDLWNPPLWEIWEYLTDYEKLGNISEIHRGVEWNIPLRKNKELLVSENPKPGFKKGLDRVPGKIGTFWAEGFVYLNMKEHYRRTNAHFLPWDRPKIISNKHLISRGPWRIVGFVDEKALVFYQTFVCIWPKPGIDPHMISAIINSPVVNAMLYSREGKRENHLSTLKNLSVPPSVRLNTKKIRDLVKQYVSLRSELSDSGDSEGIISECSNTLLLIDSLILRAYDLPPRLERKLLDLFRGYPRPVPFPFPDYFPADFKPCIPLHQYLEMDMKQISAGELIKRIEPIDSEVIHEFVLDLEERQAGRLSFRHQCSKHSLGSKAPGTYKNQGIPSKGCRCTHMDFNCCAGRNRIWVENSPPDG